MEPLREAMAQYMNGATVPTPSSGAGDLVGIAAPHVSPEGGWQSYRAAYAALGPADADRTFVILGTSVGLARRRDVLLVQSGMSPARTAIR